MGASFFCFRQPSRSQRLPKVESDDQNAGLASSVIEFKKPTWSCTGEKEKKMGFHPQEQEQQQQQEAKERTLEEWLLASPCLNKYCNNGCEYLLLKNLSHKVYPSLYEDRPKPISNSLEVLLNVEEVKPGKISRNKSANTKKRVSFRLPEEADIFIFYSPVEEED